MKVKGGMTIETLKSFSQDTTAVYQVRIGDTVRKTLVGKSDYDRVVTSLENTEDALEWATARIKELEDFVKANGLTPPEPAA